MPEQPILITEYDVKEPNLLLRSLRKVADRLIYLGNRIGALEAAPKPPAIGQIRRELEATGTAPLYIGNLLGQTAEPQIARAPHFATEPTGQILQQLRNEQIITIGNTSTGDNMYRVVGGNPNTLRLINTVAGAGLSTGYVTLGTTQTIGPGAGKAVSDTWTFNALQTFTTGISVTGGGITVSSGGGQFDSAAQFSVIVYSDVETPVVGSGTTSVSFDAVLSHNQGGMYSTGTPTRLTAGDNGIYAFGGQAIYHTNSTSTATKSLSIVISGGAVIQNVIFYPTVVSTSTSYTVALPTAIYSFSTSSYIEMRISDLGTSTTDTIGGTEQTYMWLHKLC